MAASADFLAQISEGIKARGIKAPKAKKVLLSEVDEILANQAEAAEDGSVNIVLQALQDKHGLTKAGEILKRKEDKAAVKAVGEGSSKKRKLVTGQAATVDGGADAVQEQVEDEPEELIEWEMKPEARRETAERLLALAKDRGIKMPTDDANARMAAGQAMMAHRSGDKVNVTVALASLAERFGVDPAKAPKPKARKAGAKSPAEKKPKQMMVAAVPSNQGLTTAFEELASFEFKAKDTFKGLAYKKVAKILSELDQPMTEAPKPGKLPGVGKASCEKIAQYLSTGRIEKLEEYRSQL